MPNDKIVVVTDGNPETIYEDIVGHKSTGFVVSETEETADKSKESHELSRDET